MARLSAAPVRRFPALVRVTAATGLRSIVSAPWVSPAARRPVSAFVATPRVVTAVLAPSAGLQATLQVRLPSAPGVHAAHMLWTPKVSRPSVPQLRAVRPVAVRVVVPAVHARVVVLGQAPVVVGTWVISRKVSPVHARRWGQVFSAQVHARVWIATVAIVRRAHVGVQRAPAVATPGVGVASAVIIGLQVASSMVIATAVVVATTKILLACVTPRINSSTVGVTPT